MPTGRPVLVHGEGHEQEAFGERYWEAENKGRCPREKARCVNRLCGGGTHHNGREKQLARPR